MAMEAATRASGVSAPARVTSKSSFLAPSPIRLPRRRAGGSRAVLLGVAPRSRRRDGWDADSSSSSSSGSGRLVDEGMATLRRRIREARAEASEEDHEDDMDADGDGDAGLLLPAEWTELERRHHGSYVAGVRGAVALLDALLVRARPGLGAGVLAMLLVSVPASLLLLCAQLIQAADSVSSTLLNGR